MSEVIVSKAGGTSNADAVSVEASLEWAAESDIFVVSAPGEIEEADYPKVTKQLETAYAHYESDGSVPASLVESVTQRYADIVSGLRLGGGAPVWIDQIPNKIIDAVSHGRDAASMLGERLQADIYTYLGFNLLNPDDSRADLGGDPNAWRSWLESVVVPGRKYVLPGNITIVDGLPVCFDKGGSDISGGLAAYGVRADLHRNLTDGPAMSADPRIIKPFERLRPIEHMLYVEARELGRNGTGLVHAAAMVPLMRADIPTEIRKTHDRSTAPTLLDNDYQRAKRRNGRVIALSLMRDVVILQVHEPGMAESLGRLADFDTHLADCGVTIIDSKGDGVDSQKYFVAKDDEEIAQKTLESVVEYGEVEMLRDIDLITLVGPNMQDRLFDHIFDVVFNSALKAKQWQTQGNDFSNGRHSLRISVPSDLSKEVFDSVHSHWIER
jgi:aspartate kinase